MKFDKKEIYEKEVMPLVQALYEKCEKLDIPMVLSVCVYRDNERADISSSGILSPEHTPEQFRVISGFLRRGLDGLQASLTMELLKKALKASESESIH